MLAMIVRICLAFAIGLPIWLLCLWLIERRKGGWKGIVANLICGVIPLLLGWYLSHEFGQKEYRDLSMRFDLLVKTLANRDSQIQSLEKLLNQAYAGIVHSDLRDTTASVSQIMQGLPDRINMARELERTGKELSLRVTPEVLPLKLYIAEQFEYRVKLFKEKYPFELESSEVDLFIQGEGRARDVAIRRARLPSGNYLVVEVRPGTLDLQGITGWPSIKLLEDVKNNQFGVFQIQFQPEGIFLGVNESRFPELRNIQSANPMSEEVRETINRAMDAAFTSILVREGLAPESGKQD